MHEALRYAVWPCASRMPITGHTPALQAPRTERIQGASIFLLISQILLEFYGKTPASDFSMDQCKAVKAKDLKITLHQTGSAVRHKRPRWRRNTQGMTR